MSRTVTPDELETVNGYPMPLDESDQIEKPKTLTPDELHEMDGYPGPYVEGDTTGEPDEGRCKTCKWWAEPGCSDDGSRRCEHVKLRPRPMHLPQVDGISAGDDCNHLWPGPDFGCIHHQPKTEAPA